MPTKSAALTFGRCMPASTIDPLGVELGTVGAVALLDPAGGAVDADAGRHRAVRRARLEQRLPQLGGVLHRDVELPAELADVGDAGGEDRGARRPAISRQERKPNPASETSSEVSEATMSRARGPQMPIVDTSSVRSVRSWSPSSSGRWPANHGPVGHAVGAAGDDPEVVVAQPHHGQVGAEAALRVEHRACRSPCRPRRRTGRRRCPARRRAPPGPVMSKMQNADRSITAAASRMRRCSALMIGLHQRASHSCSRGITASPYSSRRPALDSYQNGRSQPAVSKKTAPSFCWESCIGESRWSRSDSYCSAGWTMP